MTIEIGKIGKQADGSALVRYGDTIMFCAATSKKELKEPKNFLPLIVDYREKIPMPREKYRVAFSNVRASRQKEKSWSAG